jgi:uncharacterized protein (TIGR02391 family)
MARNSRPPAPRSVALSTVQAKAAIPKIERRRSELASLDVDALTNATGDNVLASYEQKINVTLREVYPVDSLEYLEYSVESLRGNFIVVSSSTDVSIQGNLSTIRSNVDSAVAKLTTLVDILKEQAGDNGSDTGSRTLRAYEGLELYQEIARAASTLYRDGHYANAVEAAVKALNGLVRLRSGLEIDGTSLMERAFSPNNPILKFNALADQSDRDEQRGFMQMFSGAVSGLRNPRAHGFIHDDPERALEFIAFVSLLAKLLDESKR